MILKLPRDLLDYVMAQTEGRAMQTVIIEILRQHKQTTYTENRGGNDDNTEKRQHKT